MSLSDAQARTTSRWISLLSGVALYGHAYLTAALRVGLPWTVHAFLQHLLFLVVTVLVVIAVFRVRGPMTSLIRTFGEGRDDWLQRFLPWQTLATAAPYVIAIWVVLQYLVWACGSRRARPS